MDGAVKVITLNFPLFPELSQLFIFPRSFEHDKYMHGKRGRPRDDFQPGRHREIDHIQVRERKSLILNYLPFFLLGMQS